MTISATRVKFDEETMWVSLQEGRTIGVPIAWFPRLRAASAEDRQAVEISNFGLHWPALDEDISVPALLAEKVQIAAE